VFVAFFWIATSLIRLVGEYLFMEKIREGQRIAEDAAEQLTEAWALSDADALYSSAVRIAAENDGRVLVMDLNGVVQTDSASEYTGQYLVFQEVASVLNGKGGTYGLYGLQDTPLLGRFRFFSGVSKESVVGLYTAPILTQDDLSGVLVLLTLSNEVIDSLTLIQQQMLLWIVLVTVAVALVIVFLVTRMINRPIEELRVGIARMAQGDLRSRVEVHGNNEFSELARAFNTMSEQLETLDQARNQFVSNASHELKTPLSTIKILIESVLYQHDANPDMQKEFLQDVDREIDRLSAVINDLLTLVRADGGETKLRLSSVRFDAIVRDILKRLALQAETAGVYLECVINDPIEMKADGTKLQQIVYNLVDNAIKYTLPGGAVKAELTRAGRRAVLRVSDTGIGIPKTDQLHVFDRFYRVDKARARDTGGTGLGLSIARQNVLLHHGNIGLLSEENVGTTFTVEIPIE
jgi:signal transduction histidine kinase